MCFNPLQIGESINRTANFSCSRGAIVFQSPSDRGVHQQCGMSSLGTTRRSRFQSPSDRGVHQQSSQGRSQGHSDSVSIPFRSGSPSTGSLRPCSRCRFRSFQSPSDRGVHQQRSPTPHRRRRSPWVSIPFRSGSPSTVIHEMGHHVDNALFQSPSDRGVHQQRARFRRWIRQCLRVSIPFRSGSPSTDSGFHAFRRGDL